MNISERKTVRNMSNTTKITELLIQVINWRNNLSKFFEDVTGLEARSCQREFFDEIQSGKGKNLVIVAGRGIGKTLAISVTALWYVFVRSLTDNHPFQVVILAGSYEQAKISYSYIVNFINNSTFLQSQLEREPTQREILFKNGAFIRPLAASETAIRGHHPDLLLFDEAAQIDDKLIYAALPMTAPSKYARQVFSTTPSEGFSWVEDKWEHQERYSYPEWKFFNWNAESFLPPAQVELLKQMLPANDYCSEIQGLPYKREGKVFRLEDLKYCQESLTVQEKDAGETYAGVDWGYSPDPTTLVVVQRYNDIWKVKYIEEYLKQPFEIVHGKIKEICLSYNVQSIYVDSTDKGECLRLSAEGLPVIPIAFKGEKTTMISNLRMLVEQRRIIFDPKTQQALIGQMLDYTYDTKKHEDLVDALMLSVKANPMGSSSRYDLDSILSAISEGKTRKGQRLNQTRSNTNQFNKVFKEIGRKE